MAPRKKRQTKNEAKQNVKRFKNKAESDDFEQIAEVDPIISNQWSECEKKNLFRSILPLLSNWPYVCWSDAIEKIKWNLVTVRNRSTEECKKQLDDMLRPMKKDRTLLEIMIAYQQEQDNKMNPTLSSQQEYNGEQDLQGNASGARFQNNDRSKKRKTATSGNRGNENVVSKKEIEEGDPEIGRPQNPTSSRQQKNNDERKVQGNALGAKFQMHSFVFHF